MATAKDASPINHESELTVLIPGMAFATTDHATLGIDQHHTEFAARAGRDRERLLCLEEQYPNWLIKTFNADEPVSACEKGKHVQGDFGARSVKKLLKDGAFGTIPFDVICLDYFEFQRRMDGAYGSLLRYSIREMCLHKLITPSTTFYVPKLTIFCPSGFWKRETLESWGFEILQMKHIRADEHPLYIATSKWAVQKSTGLINQKQLESFESESPFVVYRLKVKS